MLNNFNTAVNLYLKEYAIPRNESNLFCFSFLFLLIFLHHLIKQKVGKKNRDVIYALGPFTICVLH